MSITKSLVVIVVLSLAYACTFFAVFSEAVDSALLYKILPFDAYPRFTMPATIILTSLAFLASILVVSILLRFKPLRDQLIPITPPRAFLLGLFGLGLFITSAFGAPAVDAADHRHVVSAYKNMMEMDPQGIGEGHPYFRTYVVFPLAPCVLLSYREAAWHGRGAYGGYYVDVWYGRGIKKIWSHEVWGS